MRREGGECAKAWRSASLVWLGETLRRIGAPLVVVGVGTTEGVSGVAASDTCQRLAKAVTSGQA